MSKLSFTKYEGAGNDFILIDDRALQFSTTQIASLCHRKFGIGADGLILLQNSSIADFRMRIYNSDGNEVESCGNGLRCFGLFLADLGYAKPANSIQMHQKIVRVLVNSGQIAVEMGKPEDLTLSLPTKFGSTHFVNTGVPHAVLFVEDVAASSLQEIALVLRHQFNANVNIASVQQDGSILARVYERGIEGETLACGTGACAIAAIAQKVYGPIGNPVQIQYPGGTLEVVCDESLTLYGSARRVFEGVIL